MRIDEFGYATEVKRWSLFGIAFIHMNGTHISVNEFYVFVIIFLLHPLVAATTKNSIKDIQAFEASLFFSWNKFSRELF